MSKKGKKYNEAASLIEAGKEYSLEEAAELIGKTSLVNFDASVDIDVRLGVDPRQADQMVRGNVSLPHGVGKDVRVLALVNPAKQEEAKQAGADHVGLDEYIEKLESGWSDIDVIVATPDVMGKLGKLGRFLGPRGLMPNPKSGTVTMEPGKAIKEVKAGKIDFRVDKYGILHTSIGKASFSPDKLVDNAKAFINTVIKLRPASAKGTYVKSIYLSTTMGPSITINRTVAVK
ncbi:large subunit ribosomal protein L1 [Cyclonatronum proteinivorum]|uniref:Large ribosomal subunit protein uL1 n=1 Tax=Cyclonatronum proteinivorum TaxID=1457365 RepID=A0A345UII5_9BACT|nr:50S ribosomal protein L1 [Cyclonatronum proteinivorum]AXJ00287.1 large subunit ribosomal protein L1 [Cyclonatronum proteinivorum]